jgi:hypothetical protein
MHVEDDLSGLAVSVCERAYWSRKWLADRFCLDNGEHQGCVVLCCLLVRAGCSHRLRSVGPTES